MKLNFSKSSAQPSPSYWVNWHEFLTLAACENIWWRVSWILRPHRLWFLSFNRGTSNLAVSSRKLQRLGNERQFIEFPFLDEFCELAVCLKELPSETLLSCKVLQSQIIQRILKTYFIEQKYFELVTILIIFIKFWPKREFLVIIILAAMQAFMYSRCQVSQ